MAPWVMHRLAVKLRTVFGRMLAASGHRPVVAFPKIKMMIDMSVKMIRTVVPRSRADEYTAREPLRAIVAIGSAIVGRGFIIPVRTYRRLSNADRDLGGGTMWNSHE
jgi:hypothetical protein